MPRGVAHHLALTHRQRYVLAVLLLAGIGYAGVRLWVHASPIPDPQPAAGSRAEELADRIDPEYADWQTLAILPGIGEKKAKGITEWRDANRPVSGERVFRRVEDLIRVPGIASATLDKLRPFLEIPGEPTTAPVR